MKFVPIFFTLFMSLQSGSLMAHESHNLPAMKPVESGQVCMVTNKYMGVEQIPVSVEGKTYYGCCQDCSAKLKNKSHLALVFIPSA